MKKDHVTCICALAAAFAVAGAGRMYSQEKKDAVDAHKIVHFGDLKWTSIIKGCDLAAVDGVRAAAVLVDTAPNVDLRRRDVDWRSDRTQGAVSQRACRNFSLTVNKVPLSSTTLSDPVNCSMNHE